MPITGVDQLKRNLRKTVGRITGATTEQAVTKILFVGRSNADDLTPRDTANLINSGFREVRKTSTGLVGTVGYTANYADDVHSARGTLLGTNTPRDEDDLSRGFVWDPDGEPRFLVKGFERDGRDEIERIIRQEYRN